jgi:phospholipid transport system substrate-binding protein
MRSVLALLAALLLSLVPATAQNLNLAANPAEAFVSRTITDGFAILNDTGISRDARASRLENLLLAATDLRRIALFTLGDAAASPEQKDAFAAAFRDYALAVWRQQFLSYGGKTLAVTGSRQNAPGDVIVRAMLSDPNDGVSAPVDFRVRTDGPAPLILDVGFAGIWLAVTQRDDFAAYLARNKGDVGALAADLAARAKAIR